MPRIDPIQLLNCLSVLLSPKGGIKSGDEVQRLACLMTRFSKKLVSKCIYIQILKCTETELLGLFMESGGWGLVHGWLTESIVTKNWPLVKELLELLLLCPVDIERLKTNNCPKLVKELSKDGNHLAIRTLASKLVEQWLKTVKGEQVTPVTINDISQIILNAQVELKSEISLKSELISDTENIEEPIESKPIVIEDNIKSETQASVDLKQEIDSEHKVKDETEPETLPVLKITLKDGKQILTQVDQTENKEIEKSEIDKSRDKKDKSNSKGSSSSSKSSSSKTSSKSSSSSDKSKSKSSSSSSSSNRHSSSSRSREKEKYSSHSSKSSDKKSHEKLSSSSKSKDHRKLSSNKEKTEKETKEKEISDLKSSKSSNDKQADKPTPSIHKLGKIPKLSDVKKEKPSISIEIRKPDEPKPKTVKTFNSKFRKHGLEEEIKPPPSRASLLNKKPNPVPSPVPIIKRPSPVHNEAPPEKKPKVVEIVEKPGAIKLIPPKPKPIILLESDMFMDALNASATNVKKEPKKRKRRTSGSKDTPSEGSPPQTPTAATSPSSDSKSVPPRFYQDTLDTEEDKEQQNEKVSESDEISKESDPVENEKEQKSDASEPHTLIVNGLKGVLVYHKKKGPKRSIKWKPDDELEEIKYFELDETERVNVTKTFTDMKYLERIHEREAFQKARNLSVDDIMEEKTTWRPLIAIETEGQILVEYGKNSKEKDIQAVRQKGTLQPLYFHKSMIPDTPLEPDLETHTYTEPTIIPLEDVTGNQDNISDFRNMPWPEPKPNAPPPSTTMNVPPMFPTQFPNTFPGPQYPVVPGFQGSNMMPNDWPSGVPPQLMPNGMPMPMATPNIAPGPIPPGNLPPNMMVPPENMMMTPDMFGGPAPIFPVPPEGFNMQPNMFPPDFAMATGPPQALAGPDVFPGPEGFVGQGNFRGGMRGRGAPGPWHGKNISNWDGPNRGRQNGSRGGRKPVCMYFQRKGSCRQGQSCAFLHPGVNGPY